MVKHITNMELNRTWLYAALLSNLQRVKIYMMTSSNGNIFRVTGPLCGEFTGPGEFPEQWPVTRSFDVLFDLRLNKRLRKQSWGWWFETLSSPLWPHRNEKWKYVLCSVKAWCIMMLKSQKTGWSFIEIMAWHCQTFKSSTPSAAYIHQWIGSSLAQIMSCRLFAAKPLSKPMMGYCQLDP